MFSRLAAPQYTTITRTINYTKYTMNQNGTITDLQYINVQQSKSTNDHKIKDQINKQCQQYSK